MFQLFSGVFRDYRVFIKNIQLHAKSKPTFTITWLYNYNSDFARNTKLYITTMEPNKKQ